MLNEMFYVMVPVTIALFVFWLLYRIKRRWARTMKDKIIGDFPLLVNQLESFQRTIEYLTSRVEMLERRVAVLER